MFKVKLDRKSDKPLYVQLRDAILAAIKRQALKPGDKLPPVAALAKDLSITQATVRRALADLTRAGQVAAFVGRGTFVTEPLAAKVAEPAQQELHARRLPGDAADPGLAQAARRLRMGVARSLEALYALAQRPGLISFVSGVPDPAIAEEDILQKATAQAFKKGQEAYQGYGDLMGLPALRQVLADRLNERGCQVSPDQVMLTSGSQQAIFALAQLALEQGIRVICETPNFRGVPNAFAAIGHAVESIPRDADGPLLDRLERFRDGRPSMLYLCPEIHNPMGTDIAADRQATLVAWGKQQRALLIADEIFHDLRCEGTAPRPLLAEAGAETVAVVSSLSKSFMCGLRVGWVVSSAERVRSLLAFKRAMDVSCPPLMQAIALAILASGTYDEHVARARQHYRTRRDAALQALKQYMPEGVTWTHPVGGFHLWVELPKQYSSIALYLLAVERGVVIVPGPEMDFNHRFVHAFRLSYGSVEVPKIREGIELLGDAVRELFKAGPQDPGLSGLGSVV
jgi:2-aminoadipate transaminase